MIVINWRTLGGDREGQRKEGRSRKPSAYRYALGSSVSMNKETASSFFGIVISFLLSLPWGCPLLQRRGRT